MIIILLTALMMLCGVSIGIIVGLFLAYAAWNRQENDAADPDYSGGL